jgi:hypothetical protein
VTAGSRLRQAERADLVSMGESIAALGLGDISTMGPEAVALHHSALKATERQAR